MNYSNQEQQAKQRAAISGGMEVGCQISQDENIPTVSEFMQRQIDRMGDRMEKMKAARDQFRKVGLGDMKVNDFRELMGHMF